MIPAENAVKIVVFVEGRGSVVIDTYWGALDALLRSVEIMLEGDAEAIADLDEAINISDVIYGLQRGDASS